MEKNKGKVVHKRQEDNIIPDPLTAGAIPVDKSGQVQLVILNATETNTLDDPAFIGQELTILCIF